MKTIEIETSCGQTFHMTLEEMNDWQLTALLKQNSGRPDVDPAEIAAMRLELAQRMSCTTARDKKRQRDDAEMQWAAEQYELAPCERMTPDEADKAMKAMCSAA